MASVQSSDRRPVTMVLTRAEEVALRYAGEEEFSRWIKARARQYGWKGVHVRYSQGVIESVHTRRVDGFSEAYGLPDWLFWHEVLGQSFYAELKGVGGRQSKEQKLEIPSLQRAGQTVFIWYPRDAVLAEAVFKDGLTSFKDGLR
jgi:hypothetical protein